MSKPDLNEVRALLARVPYFADLPEGELAALAGQFHWHRYAAGAPVLARSEAAQALVVLVSGRLRVSAVSFEGRSVTFRIVEPIDIVGEIGVLDGQARSADVTAVTESAALLLPREACLATLRRCPEFAMGMIRLLCARLRDTSAGLERIATQRVSARLAHLLLRLAADYGRALPGGGVLVPMRLSQSELSMQVAATREAVNKQLRAWREEGVLGMQSGQIVLLKLEMLRSQDE